MSTRHKKLKNKMKARRLRAHLGPAPRSLPGLPGARIIATPPGHTRMSEVLWQFIEPYAELAPTGAALDKLLSLATLAWNAALYTGDKRREFIQHMSPALPPGAGLEFRQILQELIQRKEEFFADYRRLIVSCQGQMTPSGPNLSVMSTLEPV